MAEVTKCEVCEKPTTKKCGKCWKVFYCSKEHQQESWKNHQKVCRPFEVRTNEQLGRYLVATKPINEGAIILQELPLLSMPSDAMQPICMGCLNYATNLQLCKKCGWSVCNENCQNNPNHEPECYYFAKMGKKVSPMEFEFSQTIWDSILVLRGLYYEKFKPDVWQKLNQLQSHCENMTNHILTKRVIYTVCNIFGLKEEFSKESIVKLNGIIITNAFMTDTDHTAVYETVSLFEHNCKANCRKIFNSKRVARITAATPINQGDHLSLSYTDPLRPTVTRQEHLQQTKFFKCQCDRCMDITEFGTNFSALKCQKKKCEGVLLPKTFLTKGLHWICNKCKSTMKAGRVTRIYDSLELAFHAAESDIDLKAFLKNLENLLPNKHSYMIEAKIELVRVLNSPSDNDLTLKISLCQEIAEFLQFLAPTEKGVKGEILQYLQLSLAELCCRKRAAGLFGRADSFRILKERQALLNEMVHISTFKYGEEQDLETAKAELKEVEDLLANGN